MKNGLFLFGTAIALIGASAAQAQTIKNGSFEGGPAAYDNYNVDIGDTTSISGWTVVNGSNSTTGNGKGVAYIGNGSFGLTTPFGNDFLDLTSYSGSDNNSGISQTVATAIGGIYTLSFYFGQYDGRDPVSTMVYAGSQSGQVVDANASNAGVLSGIHVGRWKVLTLPLRRR